MRIHTSLTYRQMWEVAKASGAPIDLEVLQEYGSRTHERAFEVGLSGSGGRPNSGKYGAGGDYQAATWDEWGAFLGALYDADINARCGGSVRRPVYRDAEHFHFKTGSRFRLRFDVAGGTNYLPIDTHPRHQWLYDSPVGFKCRKCSAFRPSWEQAESYAPRAYR